MDEGRGAGLGGLVIEHEATVAHEPSEGAVHRKRMPSPMVFVLPLALVGARDDIHSEWPGFLRTAGIPEDR